MFHRVVPRSETMKGIQAGMYVELETFEAHLQFLQDYLKVVSLSELTDDIKFKSRIISDKPICVLTFDDGWCDFYKYVYPSLKAQEIPATVFLPTDFIGTNKRFWTDRLTFLFFQRENLKSTVRGNGIPAHPLVNKLEALRGPIESQLEKAIQILKEYPNEEMENILSEISMRWDISLGDEDRAFLSWEEVREMEQSGIISFGSHTARHKILTTLTDEEVREELISSKENLISEKAVNGSFLPFSYPNGNYNKKIARMVKETGYSLGVTTESGWNDSGSNPFRLRRIGIHQDITSTEAMFGCRIVNIF